MRWLSWSCSSAEVVKGMSLPSYSCLALVAAMPRTGSPAVPTRLRSVHQRFIQEQGPSRIICSERGARSGG